MTKKNNTDQSKVKDIYKFRDRVKGDITDENIRKFLQDGIQEMCLPELQKQALKQAVLVEAALCREGLVKRLWRRVQKFMETTFEISLAPVATALGILLVVTATVGYGYIGSPLQLNNRDPAAYIGQTITAPDGSAHIVFRPLDRGES